MGNNKEKKTCFRQALNNTLKHKDKYQKLVKSVTYFLSYPFPTNR